MIVVLFNELVFVCVGCYLSGRMSFIVCFTLSIVFFFFQAEDGIRDLVRSRGLGDVYKRQGLELP